MPKSLDPAKDNGEHYNLLRSVVSDFHPDLESVSTTFKIMLVSHSEGSPVVKHDGQFVPVAAKATTGPQRAMGLPDVAIEIDVTRWNAMGTEERRAKLDGALMRLELARDKEGGIKYDDRGRPKFRRRKPDLYVCGYSAVVARHKHLSLESQQFEETRAVLSQRHFDFTDDMAPQDEMPDVIGMFDGKEAI